MMHGSAMEASSASSVVDNVNQNGLNQNGLNQNGLLSPTANPNNFGNAGKRKTNCNNKFFYCNNNGNSSQPRVGQFIILISRWCSRKKEN